MISAQQLISCRTPGLCVQILYSVLLLWTKEMHGLSDFSNYLLRIINSHSAQACDGDLLILRCPRHSTITIQSAFYGQSEALPGIVPGMRCQWRNHSCSATTALQKVLSECQGYRDCQLLVSHQVFGLDPCPGTPKYLHVSYRCKPTEHKKRVTCEGDRLLLHCKYAKVLNIYSAVYGRQMEEEDPCLSEKGEHPPFECLFHGAVDVVRNICYGKQRCLLAIDEEHFKDPCPPGTKKYLSVLYACVPQTLLKVADPNSFQTTSVPNQTTKAGEHPIVRSSKFPDNRIIISNSLMAYGYITEHPEMAGLLFTSSVCVGLLIVLVAVSTQITCRRHFSAPRMLSKKSKLTMLEEKEPMNQDNDDEEDDKGSDSLLDSSNLSEVGQKMYCWEDVTYTTEAAELMERIERRELVIQEIRMNAYLNGNTCILHSDMPTIKQNVR
ncbi:protein eva-1 homolog C-like [Myxocyprinus asiaticus]|uniref:protein eva-1 homolog C-like n=1 Tax=Myxocyprinus asiaticus TaxID=70543 RepID=UPI00222228BF|nr:protein eva-1 homolog C-like [Myxocyprinus asiaticus]